MRKITLKLNARKDGRFGKKIDGVYRTWPTEDAARSELLALIAAREGQAAAIQSATVQASPLAPVKLVLNAFLADREKSMRGAQIKPSTFLDYKGAITAFCEALDGMKTDPLLALGRQSPIIALQPGHFRLIRQKWSERLGAHALDRNIQAIRTAFKWAIDPGRIIPSAPNYGGEFKKTTKADKRKDRATREGKSGEHRFTPSELAKILGAATGAMRCFVLLGLNCGMYAAEIAALKFTDIRRHGKATVIDTYRPKTQIRQVAPLWPETVTELEKYLAWRRTKKTIHCPDLIFVTHSGNPWVQDHFTENDKGAVAGGGNINSTGLMFRRLLKDLGIHRAGVGFGAFRHTHISATSRHPDINARRVIRGHRVEGIEEHYDFHDYARLKSITDLARKLLLLPALKRTHGRR